MPVSYCPSTASLHVWPHCMNARRNGCQEIITASPLENCHQDALGLSRILHHDLQWLDVTERIQFRVAATGYQCLHGMAPAYLTELCTPVTASASRRGGLRSVTTSYLVVPRCRLSTYGTRAFNVAGPVCWNALPDYLKSADLSFDVFKHHLKTLLVKSCERKNN